MRIPADHQLPVGAVLPEIIAALVGGGSAVLVAPPGAGKTTLVPLALADAFPGRIVVAEPRRVAARAAARRMAAMLGGRVGEQVGFSVRGESRVGRDTRVEVVTTGVLLRRMQRDPELPGVGAVVLDECHERHADTDLALAFLIDLRSALRPDLPLLATSATIDADRLAGCLGEGVPAPVISTPVATYPTEIVWAPPPAAVTPAYGLQVDPRLLDHVAATVRRAIAEAGGDVLVFLPGTWEINAVASRLSSLAPAIDVIALHGRQPAHVQDAALATGDRRRIVLATSVAESSLTVPGVRIVVDSGLAREPRTDHARGLGSLVTVRASKATATQRAGRAGREGPGHVYRCWSAADHDRRPEHGQPEIAIADLTGFALELACWGHPDGSGLRLLDPPPPAAMQVAVATLRDLGAVDEDGRVTARGRAISAVPAHPRLARALLDGAATVGPKRAAEIVAILAEDAAGGSDDLVAVWRRLRDNADRGATARWREASERLTNDPSNGPAPIRMTDDLAAGLIVGLAFPERLAKARSAGSRTYLMTRGTAADLDRGTALTGVEWLAIAVADRAPGAVNARIRLAVAIDEATARQAAAPMHAVGDEVEWRDDDVIARRVERLGAVVLAESRLTRPDPALVAEAVATGIRREGLNLLVWSAGAVALRRRLAFARHAYGDPWPEVDDAALLARVPDWLGPDLVRARHRADLARIDVISALRRLLDWRLVTRLDDVAPERVTVPSGSQVRIDYEDPAAPVLAVKIQEAYGWPNAPTIADGRITLVLHLLSPAGRPAAITSDLPSFWRNGYPQVRAELRGRYPRHAWPEDPTTAPATRRLNPRS
jgi:ATP-dependent helicase HrpB